MMLGLVGEEEAGLVVVVELAGGGLLGLVVVLVELVVLGLT